MVYRFFLSLHTPSIVHGYSVPEIRRFPVESKFKSDTFQSSVSFLGACLSLFALLPAAASAASASRSIASTTKVVSSTATSASSTVQSWYAQCAQQVSGAQGSTYQTAYTLSADTQAALKQCLRDARDSEQLLYHQTLETCLQTNASTTSTSTQLDLYRLCRNQIRSDMQSTNPSLSGGSGHQM